MTKRERSRAGKALQKLAHGKPKTMTAAALEQRRKAAAASVISRAKKKSEKILA